MSTHRRSSWPLAGWVVLLAAVLAVLTAAGPAPPPAAPDRWAQWLRLSPPVEVAFALLRLSALAVAWYLAVATAAGLVLRVAGAPALSGLADRVTVPVVRRMLAGVGTATVALSTGAAAQAPSPIIPGAPPAAESTITMRRLPPADPVPAGQAPAAPDDPVPAGGSAWTVRPGECFWSVADQVLRRTWGRAATEAEIVPYWNRLIAANRAALPDPANPDLVYPGQTFTLPAP